MRNKIPVDREIFICSPTQYETPTSDNVIRACKQMAKGEIVIGIRHIQEHREPGFGSMTEEPVWVNIYVLQVRKMRDETDEEYLIRRKNEERLAIEQLERDKLQYLNLKAKFEK